ncbi:ANTAR domain-containing protein [Kribbella sp. NPDC049174]|uniref:ANTAR domain-containing protein n=1 Tax=Kribbella sp. NPDC049174 TaxID=3364112 RepID=UPI003721BD45
MNAALQSRSLIGQAIGIVMERYRLDSNHAFGFLSAPHRPATSNSARSRSASWPTPTPTQGRSAAQAEGPAEATPARPPPPGQALRPTWRVPKGEVADPWEPAMYAATPRSLRRVPRGWAGSEAQPVRPLSFLWTRSYATADQLLVRRHPRAYFERR